MNKLSFTGEFLDEHLEVQFRDHTIEQTKQLNLTFSTLVLVAALLLLAGEIENVSMEVIVTRLLQIAIPISAFVLTLFSSQTRVTYLASYVLAGGVTLSSLLIDFTRPPDYLAHLGLDVLCIMFIHLIVPSSVVRVLLALAYSTALLALHFTFKEPDYDYANIGVPTAVVVANLMGFLTARLFHRTRRLTFLQVLVERSLRERIETARNEVRALRRALPICFSCKKVRNDDGFWDDVETLILSLSGARVSHGLCPDCADEYKQ